jgi:hypothetical protein
MDSSFLHDLVLLLESLQNIFVTKIFSRMWVSVLLNFRQWGTHSKIIST